MCLRRPQTTTRAQRVVRRPRRSTSQFRQHPILRIVTSSRSSSRRPPSIGFRLRSATPKPPEPKYFPGPSSTSKAEINGEQVKAPLGSYTSCGASARGTSALSSADSDMRAPAPTSWQLRALISLPPRLLLSAALPGCDYSPNDVIGKWQSATSTQHGLGVCQDRCGSHGKRERPLSFWRSPSNRLKIETPSRHPVYPARRRMTGCC